MNSIVKQVWENIQSKTASQRALGTRSTFWGTERDSDPFLKVEWGTERGTERVPEIRGTKLRSVLWSFFQSYLWQIWKWQPWKMNWYFFRKWLLFIKMFYFLFRLDDHGAFKTHILAKKIVSLNCLFLQRNGNGTTVPLLWNEERRMRSFYQIWNEERNAFLFFSKERGTERVPEIRRTTKAMPRANQF